MTDHQEQHLHAIIDDFTTLVDAKFRAGAAEHDSDLSTDYSPSQILDMAIEEAIDQCVYLLTLRSKL